MSRRPPPPAWATWLRANGHDLAGLTGADFATLTAIDACWQSLGYVDSRPAVFTAVASLLPNMQEQFHPYARELIARALDWGDRARIWPLVAGPTDLHRIAAEIEGKARS